jgi:uncharacterized protein YcaQ
VRFLSPLDNLIATGSDEGVFQFHDLWEIYNPAERPTWGAYTLLILYRDRLAGRVDPKLDRASGALIVQGIWFEEESLKEDEVFRRVLANGVEDVAGFHAANRLELRRCSHGKLRDVAAPLPALAALRRLVGKHL